MLSIKNYQKCQSAFFRWMKEQYNIDISAIKQIDFDKEMYTRLKEVSSNNNNSDYDIETLNNIVLNKVQKLYVDALGLVKTQAGIPMNSLKQTSPNMVLDRDEQTFGQRTLPTIPDRGLEHASNRTETLSAFDKLKLDRDESATLTVEVSPLPKPQVESAMDFMEFQSKVNEMKEEMFTMFPQHAPTDNQIVIDDQVTIIPAIKNIQNNQNSDNIIARGNAFILQRESDLCEANEPTTRQEQDLIPRPTAVLTTNSFITINGFDRNTNQYPKRYRFGIDMSAMSRDYKLIHDIEFTRLIIPMELIEKRTVNNPQPKYTFVHDQRFSYPYLLLQVDELQNVYDGLNDQVRRTTTQFIYDTGYRCPNGRGYVILRPSQNEKRSFIQPVSSLQKLTFSIVKPNGALFNTGEDDINIIKFEYEVYNSLLIKIVTDKFFDKNDFCIGDTVMLNTLTPFNFDSMDSNELMQFINRSEGHDVIQMGEANENGFYRSFYINALQKLDTCVGKMVVNKPSVDIIRAYNTNNTINLCAPVAIGSIINISLQVTLSFKMTTEAFLQKYY